MTSDVNAGQTANWNGPAGAGWARNWRHYDATVPRQHDALLSVAAIAPEEVVLDIGCGNGQTTVDAARAARDGSVVGIDLSSSMLARARARCDEEGIANAELLQADAQVHDLGVERFDVALSRFGVMFFADPVAAFRNVARALRKPGGRVAWAVWQGVERNDQFLVPMTVMSAGRPLPSEPPGLPGPFALADREHTARWLGAAGFSDIAFESFEAPYVLGTDVDDAFDFACTLSMVTSLAADLDDDSRRRAFEELRDAIEQHATDDGVVFDSAIWLITARVS